MRNPAFQWVALFVVCMVNMYGIRYWARLCWREPGKLMHNMPPALARIYPASTHVRVMRGVVTVWSLFVQGLILICLWNLTVPFLRDL